MGCDVASLDHQLIGYILALKDLDWEKNFRMLSEQGRGWTSIVHGLSDEKLDGLENTSRVTRSA